MAAQRLRKTFKYPSESDDEDAVEAGMDEQDQAQIISSLSSHDSSATHTYTLLLLILPLAPIILYIPRLFSLDTVLPGVAAIASLLASAYTLYFLPLPPQEVTVVDVSDGTGRDGGKGKGKGTGAGAGKSTTGLYKRNVPAWEKKPEKPMRRPVPYISSGLADWLAEYITAVNRAVGGLLALEQALKGEEWSQGFVIGGGYLPLLICLVVLWARTELRILDISALETLKMKSREGGEGREGGKMS